MSLLESFETEHLEAIVSGSIFDSALEGLLHRLQALCDPCRRVSGLYFNTFQEHHIVYSFSPEHNEATGDTSGPTHFTDLFVKVSFSVLPKHSDSPWNLQLMGGENLEKSKYALVRHRTDCACTGDYHTLLTDLGFLQKYEYFSRGYFFQKGDMKITISKISKKTQKDGAVSIVPMTSSHLVEISAIVPPPRIERAQEEIHMLSQSLKPMVNLERLSSQELL